MDFHFVMGRIASAAGDDALARRHFKEAHAKASIAKESAMDGIIAALSGDRREATFAAKVRIVSGLNAKPEDVVFKCRQYVEAKGVKGDDAEDLKPKKTERKPTQEDDFQIEILQPKGGAR